MNPLMPNHYREILLGLGENPEREGLLDTPKRAAKAMQYLCHGYQQNLDEIVNGALFASDNDEMVILKDIELVSICEHHLLPFTGVAHIAYLPTEKVAGLGRLANVVEILASRPQLQENLTAQVADAIETGLSALGVVVVIEARHQCVASRGARQPEVNTITMATRGRYSDPVLRSEIMGLISRGS